MNRRVSIVVPVYNSHATLPKCLDSLIAQTYQDIEIICVNDSSKDNSIDVIKEYQQKDNRIVLINHEENKNAGGARNSGIKASSGNYICFVDNDDWLTQDAISKLVEQVDEDTDMVASDWVDYAYDGKSVVRKNLTSTTSFSDNLQHVCYYGFRMLGCLFRKSLFYDNNLFFPEKIFYEDNAILMSLFYLCKNFKYVEEPLYYYASVPTSVTQSTTVKKLTDRTTTIEMQIENLRRIGVKDKDEEMLNLVALRLCYRSIYMCSQFSLKEVNQVLERTSQIIKGLLPNTYFKNMSRIKYVAISHPYFSFCVFKMIRILLPVYRKIRE